MQGMERLATNIYRQQMAVLLCGLMKRVAVGSRKREGYRLPFPEPLDSEPAG